MGRRGRRDHPRTRGEKTQRINLPSTHRGSPPHARGKDGVVHHIVGRKGITPARAGKSFLRPPEWTRNWDHPRTRGEKDLWRLVSPRLRGSPPHARGKAATATCTCWPCGITPARAGKSYRTGRGGMGNRDHPRTRGEKSVMGAPQDGQKGSPPHARGKDRRYQFSGGLERITPARAGKRTWSTWKPWPWRDHPRTRGEKRKHR